jgi:hypothetical protein
MRKSHNSKITVLGALCCAFSTACSGGGEGGMSQAASAGTSSNMTSTTSTNTTSTNGPNSSGFDTGISGTVAAPSAATFGSAPPQLATSGGSTFDGSSGSYPANITFPLITSGLQQTSTGLSPTPSDSAATLTVVSSSSSASTVQLMVPSLSVNQPITFVGSLANVGDSINIAYGLSYTSVGFWSVGRNAASPATPLSFGAYLFGFESPQAAMPTSGTAVFSGQGLAQASVYKTIGTDIQTWLFRGNPSISVNFGSGAINGGFTQMSSGAQLWNDVSVTANIATGTNRFSGTAAAASAPGTPMSLSGSATGSINGAFYGPAAQQLGAVWSLSDGTGSAIGTVVAGH